MEISKNSRFYADFELDSLTTNFLINYLSYKLINFNNFSLSSNIYMFWGISRLYTYSTN